MDQLHVADAQRLLLRAALAPADAAQDAYARWRSLVPFAAVDPEAYRLLPCLYANLQALGAVDDLAARLRGVYRRTWYANQLALPHLAAALTTWQAAGIETRILGGPLAILQYSADAGLYPLDGGDVLVRPQNMQHAGRLLAGRGWSPASRHDHPMQDTVLVHPQGGYLTLRSRIVHQGDAADHVWQQPVAIAVGDQTGYLLNPVDHLLFLAEYGVQAGQPATRWLPDAAFLVRQAPALDWAELTVQARLRHARPSLQQLLVALESVLSLHSPAGIIEELARPDPAPAWVAPTVPRRVIARRRLRAARVRLRRFFGIRAC